MFVPKGYVPLTVAVEQLATARFPARDTSNDRLNAARAELRTELHSGSMVAIVIHPGSGKTYTIHSDRWALNEAVAWLEQGTCPLTNGLVSPSLGLMNEASGAAIFLSLQDLQDLRTKHGSKEEQASHGQLAPKPMSEAEAKRKFAAWRKSRGEDTPSEKEDIEHMKQYGVSRERVRKLRQGVGVKRRPTGKRRRP